jgi:hypothetical protein
MKTAVDKVKPGKLREVNARFIAMISHYLFDPEFCNPASGWEKGQIEKNVSDSRHRLWQRAPAVRSLAELNDWLADQFGRAAQPRGRDAAQADDAGAGWRLRCLQTSAALDRRSRRLIKGVTII